MKIKPKHGRRGDRRKKLRRHVDEFRKKLDELANELAVLKVEQHVERLDALSEAISRIKVGQHTVEEKVTTIENVIDRLKVTLAEVKRGGSR